MKRVYKCDYCNFLGTEDEVREHESNCTEDYTKRSCYTCKNRGEITFIDHKIKYGCEAGKDIPAGNVCQYCDLYEQKEKSIISTFNNPLFGSLF